MKLVRPDPSTSLPSPMVGGSLNRYGIVGRSRVVADVIRRIELVAATRSTVLITGETGCPSPQSEPRGLMVAPFLVEPLGHLSV